MHPNAKPALQVSIAIHANASAKYFGKVPFSWAKLGLIAAGVVALIGLLRLLGWLLQ